MDRVYRVAVVLGKDATFSRQILRGILSCPRHPYHIVFNTWPVEAESLPLIRDWRADGIIGNLNRADVVDGVFSFAVPIVNFADKLAKAARARDVPQVKVDDHAVGAMAGDYFLRQGFRNFAFSHFVIATQSTPSPFSIDRFVGFSGELKKAGLSCQHVGAYPHDDAAFLRMSVGMHPYNDAPSARPYVTDNPEERWLRTLPKPVAILAANDIVAARILDGCVHAGLRVPEDIAVLGVDNDDVACLMSEVALSSVETPTIQVGFHAMAMMKRLLKGDSISCKPVLLPPLRVVERLSSNRLAVGDESVAAALLYIRDHISEPLTVARIAADIMVSRRQLEMKFRAAMHQTPLEQIQQERFEQARRMLMQTDQTVTEIARRVGLSRPDALSKLFRQKSGLTASEYRDKNRQADSERPTASAGKSAQR